MTLYFKSSFRNQSWKKKKARDLGSCGVGVEEISLNIPYVVVPNPDPATIVVSALFSSMPGVRYIVNEILKIMHMHLDNPSNEEQWKKS